MAQLALLGIYEGDTHRAGAAAGVGTYVPKSMLATDLIPTLEALLNWSEGGRERTISLVPASWLGCTQASGFDSLGWTLQWHPKSRNPA